MKKYQNASSVPLHLFFIAATATTIFSAFILAFFYSKLAHPLILDSSILVPHAREGLMPEPQERFVFLVLALMVPVASFLMALTVFRRVDQRYMSLQCQTGLNIRTRFFSDKAGINHNKKNLSSWFIEIPMLAAIAILYFPFIGYYFSQALPTNQNLPSEHTIFVLSMTLLVATGWCVAQLSCTARSLTTKFNSVSRIISWVIFVTVMLLQIGAWRIRNEMSISSSQAWDWYNHAEIILNSISQVMAGKTLLVDLPSQYGLYPELLMPIFKLIGLSIFNFTAVCAVLQVLSLGAVYWVVQRSVRDPLIRIAFGLTLIMITFGTVIWLIGIPDPYYQYWPIRFFWPAMSVLFFYRYSNKPTLWRVLPVSLVGAIGTLWNMDSGLMIVLAFAGVLVAKWVVLWSADRHAYKTERRQLVNALIIHVATFVIVGLLMFGYLFLKGGGALHWYWLVGYQKLFYGLGFYMLPMPLYPSPWMSILGVYLIALIVAARTWVLYPHAKSADLLTFLSLLGLGLFVYYQGRSHPLNLVTVCWPALVLIALLADRVQRAVHTGLLSRHHIMISIAALSVLLFCSLPLVLSLDKLGKQAIIAFEHRNIPTDALVSDELSFIRSHTTPSGECLILSRREGLYYAAIGIGSPVSGPGFDEMLLQRDRDDFVDKLILKRYKCIFVGLGESSAPDFGVDPMAILQGYDIIARNQHGSMLYLEPQRQVQHAAQLTPIQPIIERSAAYLHTNKFNRAISLLKQAIMINPDNADLYNNLCVAYGVKKEYIDAVSACSNAVRIAPDDQLAKNNLAWVEHENRTRNEL